MNEFCPFVEALPSSTVTVPHCNQILSPPLLLRSY
jgi:hypothetical protein